MLIVTETGEDPSTYRSYHGWKQVLWNRFRRFAKAKNMEPTDGHIEGY